MKNIVENIMKVKYEEMLPHEIVKVRISYPVAYLSIGGLEWHGEHLAVGNDALKAHALAIRCADTGGGLAFPPLYWGENRESHLMETNQSNNEKILDKMELPKANFAPGYMDRSIYQQDMSYIELLVHMLRQVDSLGFKVIVIIAGHYPLLSHARSAVHFYTLDGKAKAWACSGYELVKDTIPESGDHAAKWETSLLMALRPDCVDMSLLPKDKNIPLIGVSGIDPRGTASKEYGEKAVELIVGRIIAKAHNLLTIRKESPDGCS